MCFKCFYLQFTLIFIMIRLILMKTCMRNSRFWKLLLFPKWWVVTIAKHCLYFFLTSILNIAIRSSSYLVAWLEYSCFKFQLTAFDAILKGDWWSRSSEREDGGLALGCWVMVWVWLPCKSESLGHENGEKTPT